MTRHRERVVYLRYPEAPQAVLPLQEGHASLHIPLELSAEDAAKVKAWLHFMLDLVDQRTRAAAEPSPSLTQTAEGLEAAGTAEQALPAADLTDHRTERKG